MQLNVSDHKNRKMQYNKRPNVPPIQEQVEAKVLVVHTRTILDISEEKSFDSG